MATTHTGPTPWDADIAELRKGKPRDTWIALPRLEAKAEAYRLARSEDAALLESFEALLEAAVFTLSVMRANHDDIELSERMAISKLERAIARFQGKEA